jgi:hypothetical protein
MISNYIIYSPLTRYLSIILLVSLLIPFPPHISRSQSAGVKQAPESVPGDEHWQAGFQVPGTDNSVRAMVSDDCGNLYIGGDFITAGGALAKYVARWDGSAWSPLGSGMDGWIQSLAIDEDGNLYAGGWFTTAGDVEANYIAMWDGDVWTALGSGMDSGVQSLTVDNDGNVRGSRVQL